MCYVVRSCRCGPGAVLAPGKCWASPLLRAESRSDRGRSVQLQDQERSRSRVRTLPHPDHCNMTVAAVPPWIAGSTLGHTRSMYGGTSKSRRIQITRLAVSRSAIWKLNDKIQISNSESKACPSNSAFCVTRSWTSSDLSLKAHAKHALHRTDKG